jgi:hypothetical protein
LAVGAPPLIYFLKAFPGSSDPPGERSMAFAWAEHVRRLEDRLEARNIQVAAPLWRNGKWSACGRRLPDRTFAGHAYRVPAPEWFVRQNPPGRRSEAGIDRGALELRLHTTPLGRMCRNLEVRLALAQDRLAAATIAAAHLPDLLAGEDRLYQEWKLERPAAAAEAAVAMAALENGCGHWPAEIRRWRRRLRGAALRRLDAAATGREIFVPCPATFGEPYLSCDLAPGLSLKAGIVRRAEFWPSLEGEARSRTWRTDGRLVAAVEAALFSFWPATAWTEADFAKAAAVRLGAAALQEFEASSPLPLFPPAMILPEGRVPSGYRIRIRSDTMRGLGGSYLTLAAAGLSPYIARPFYDYCAERREALAADCEDVAGLAAAKWGHAPHPQDSGIASPGG